MNYYNTFIAVADDSNAGSGTPPPTRAARPTIAQLEYALIAAHPYALTQEDVQFSVHARRQEIAPAILAADSPALRAAFFSRPMACMRTSPLPKTYGWGLHFDPAGKVALVAVDSPDYERLANDPGIQQTRAMRSKRA